VYASGEPRSTPVRDNYSGHVTWEFGAMKNRGAKSAVGATVLLGTDATSGRFGVKGRYRRWLSPQGIALDLGAGVLRGGTAGSDRSAIITSDASVNYFDYGALTARAEFARVNGDPRASLFAGARLGSKPATAVTVVMAGLFALFVVASFSAWSD
jgi:hypothetical protein